MKRRGVHASDLEHRQAGEAVRTGVRERRVRERWRGARLAPERLRLPGARRAERPDLNKHGERVSDQRILEHTTNCFARG